jgi:amidophosphoribosyltransferase
MCGVVGIFSNEEIGVKIWLSLLALQHRGQDACGIITHKGGRFFLKKGKGTIQSVFKEEEIKRLRGEVGIGHVRYPTIGKGDPEDAQPFYTNSPFGMCMAYNGNIINYSKIKKKLMFHCHRHINTQSDVEVILNLLASKIPQNNLFDAIYEVMEELIGSYSCVCYIANQGMVAFRDPCGIKPLMFGKKEGEVCFTSESPVLDMLGYKEIRDVFPGEVIFVDKRLKIHSKIIKPNPHRHCIFEYIYFARPDSILDGVSVYEARLRLGYFLAKEVKKKGIKPEVIIPIPDTARATALGIAQVLGVPYREGLIKNRYVGRTFIMPRDINRKEWVKYKLNPLKSEIEGKRVLLVDDSIVRGSTSRAIVKLVREVFPTEVYFAVSSSPLKYPCYYGIDMQTKQEFIAREKSVEEIEKEIEVNALIYQPIEYMVKAVQGGGSDSYCTACFDGNYPTKVDTKEVERIEKERLKLELLTSE